MFGNKKMIILPAHSCAKSKKYNWKALKLSNFQPFSASAY
jgi:hypothetical protein